jgi:phosphoenolpyruvate carboxykinase (GTP)
LPKTHIPIESHSCLISKLPISVQDYIEEKAKICQPDSIYVCDGSEEENKSLLNLLEKDGWIQRLEGNK